GRYRHGEWAYQPARCKVDGDQSASPQDDAFALDGCLHGVLRGMKHRTPTWIYVSDADDPEPGRPLCVQRVVNERVVSKLGRRAQSVATFEEPWAAHRREILLHQQLGNYTGIVPLPVPYRDIDPIADKIRELLGRRKSHVNVVVRPAKPEQS